MYTQAVYQQQVFVILTNNKFDLNIIYGEYQKLFENDSTNIFRVKLFKARGGNTKLFGKIKLNKGGDAYKAKRIQIIYNKKIVKRYSYNEILKMKTEMIDTFKVYVVPD